MLTLQISVTRSDDDESEWRAPAPQPLIVNSDSSSPLRVVGATNGADPPTLPARWPTELDEQIRARSLPTNGESAALEQIQFVNSEVRVRITYFDDHRIDTTLHGWTSELTFNKGRAFCQGHVIKKRCSGVLRCTLADCPGRWRVPQRFKEDTAIPNCETCESPCVWQRCDVRFTYTFQRGLVYIFTQSGPHDHVPAQAAHLTVAERRQFHIASTAAKRGISGVQIARPLVASMPFASRLNSTAAVRRLHSREQQLALPASLAEEARFSTATPSLIVSSASPWMYVFAFLPMLTCARERLRKGGFLACCADSTRNMFVFSPSVRRSEATEIHVTGIVFEHNNQVWPLAIALTTQITTEVYALIFREFLQHTRALALSFPRPGGDLPPVGVTIDIADTLAHGFALAMFGIACSNSTVEERAHYTRTVAEKGHLRFCQVHWVRASVNFASKLSGDLQKDLESALHHLYNAVRKHGVLSDHVARFVDAAVKCRAVRGVTVEAARQYFAWYMADGGLRLSTVCGAAEGADRLQPTTNWVEGLWGTMKQHYGFRNVELCGAAMSKLVNFVVEKSAAFERRRMGMGSMPVAIAPNLLPTRDGRRRRRSREGASARASHIAAVASMTPVAPDMPVNAGVARTLTQREIDRQRALHGNSAVARRAHANAVTVERITQAPPYVAGDLHRSITLPASQDAPIGSPLQLDSAHLKGFPWPQAHDLAPGLFADTLILFVAIKAAICAGDDRAVIEPMRTFVEHVDRYFMEHVRGNSVGAQTVLAAACRVVHHELHGLELETHAPYSMFTDVFVVGSAPNTNTPQRLTPQRRPQATSGPPRRRRRTDDIDSEDEFAPTDVVSSNSSCGGSDSTDGDRPSSAIGNDDAGSPIHVLAAGVIKRFGNSAQTRPLVIAADVQHQSHLQFGAAWQMMSQLPLRIEVDEHVEYELIGVQYTAGVLVWIAADVADTIRLRAPRGGECGLPIAGNAVYERHASDAAEKQNRANVHVRGRSGRAPAHTPSMMLAKPGFGKIVDKVQFMSDHMPLRVYYVMRCGADVVRREVRSGAAASASASAVDEMQTDEAVVLIETSSTTTSTSAGSLSSGWTGCAVHGSDVEPVGDVRDRDVELMDTAFEFLTSAVDASPHRRRTAADALKWLRKHGCQQCAIGRSVTMAALFIAYDLLIFDRPDLEWSWAQEVALLCGEIELERDIMEQGLYAFDVCDLATQPLETLLSTVEAPLFVLRNGRSLCALNSVVQALACLSFDIRTVLNPGDIVDAWTRLIQRHTALARQHKAAAIADDIASKLMHLEMSIGEFQSAHEVMDHVLSALSDESMIVVEHRRTCLNRNCKSSIAEAPQMMTSVASLDLASSGSVRHALASRCTTTRMLDPSSNDLSSCCQLSQVQSGGWLLQDSLTIDRVPVLVIQLHGANARRLDDAKKASIPGWSLRAIVVAIPNHFYCYGQRHSRWPGRAGFVFDQWYEFDCHAPSLGHDSDHQAHVRNVGDIDNVFVRLRAQTCARPYLLVYQRGATS